MEESILDVEMVDRPIPGEIKGHDGVNYHGHHNRAKSLIIIDTGTLHETVKKQ
jgi:hypothetical protein